MTIGVASECTGAQCMLTVNPSVVMLYLSVLSSDQHKKCIVVGYELGSKNRKLGRVLLCSICETKIEFLKNMFIVADNKGWCSHDQK